MAKWIWPISWYWRIRELETQIFTLKARERELLAQIRAQAVESALMTGLYIAVVDSMAETMGNPHVGG
jgi:hypothetical protein